MANEAHLARLKQGMDGWNQWRDESREIRPDLRKADLTGAHLTGAHLTGANLSSAKLERALLIQTNLEAANLTGCAVYGTSTWDLQLNDKTEQKNLIISKRGDPSITVDNIEVAQFIYLLLNNQKIREIFNTIADKVCSF
jgi:uncharacterized protein YjbI with pentapeptide repeats